MSEMNSSTTQVQGADSHGTETGSNDKGKGKATDPTQDVSMGEDDDDDEDTSEDEVDEVSVLDGNLYYTSS
jgi:hypothetical protein